MPSTVEWCILAMTAMRPSSSALDHPDLPQRLGPVELAAGDVAGQVGQFEETPGRGDGGAADVVVDVEVGVVHPHRVAQAERDLDQQPSEHGRLVGARGDLGLHLGERVAAGHGGRVEHGDHLHVHVEGGRLEVEEAGVEAAQRFHRPPSSSGGPPPSGRRPDHDATGRHVPYRRVGPSRPGGRTGRRARRAGGTDRAPRRGASGHSGRPGPRPRCLMGGCSGSSWPSRRWSALLALLTVRARAQGAATPPSTFFGAWIVGELPVHAARGRPGRHRGLRHRRCRPTVSVWWLALVLGLAATLAYVGLAVVAHRIRRPGGRRHSTRPPGGPMRAEGVDLSPAWAVVVAGGAGRPLPVRPDPPDPQHRLRGRRDLPPQARRPRAPGRSADGGPGAPLHPRRRLGDRRQAGAGDPDDARAGRTGLGVRGHQLPAEPQGDLAGPHRRLQAGDRLGARPTSATTAATRRSSPCPADRPAGHLSALVAAHRPTTRSGSPGSRTPTPRSTPASPSTVSTT